MRVGLCEELASNNKFVVYLGYSVLQHGIKDYLDGFMAGDYDAMVLLKEVEDPTKFEVPERGRYREGYLRTR
ncbi:MAG: hypothetical protein QXR45_10790 [Candidatus Bathyarchaeia archaeon]